jgi:hypothetical protein
MPSELPGWKAETVHVAVQSSLETTTMCAASSQPGLARNSPNKRCSISGFVLGSLSSRLQIFFGSVLKGSDFQPSRPVRCHLHLRYTCSDARTLRTRMCEALVFGHSDLKRQVGRPSFPSTRRKATLPWQQASLSLPSFWSFAGAQKDCSQLINCRNSVLCDRRAAILMLVKKPSDLTSQAGGV